MGAHELTLVECELWMIDLGYVADGQPDWLRMLKDAKIGSKAENLHNVRSRWRTGGSKRNRKKVREFLEATEAKKGPTRFGTVIRGLEDWQRIGDALAARPKLFLAVKGRVEELLAKLTLTSTAVDAAAEIEAIEDGLSPFEPPPDESPSSSRRHSSTRRDFTPDRSPRK